MSLARLQQLLTGGLMAAAGLWLGAWWHSSPAWALGGAIFILLGYAPLLALEFSLRYVAPQGGEPVPRARVRALVRAWLGEVVMAPRVFFWRQPFHADAVPDHLPDHLPKGGRRGVVLVHGLFCNRGFWTPWMAQLKRDNRVFVAVNLVPIWGGIDGYADMVEAAVRRVTAATGLPPVLICHSMGGLAARVWWRRPGAGSRVHRLVSIASPHAGTWMARFGHGANGVQMRLHSDWLARLNLQGEPPAHHAQWVCWYSDCDNLVFPVSTATLPGADNRLVPGLAHVALAFDPRVMRETLALV